MKFINLKNKKIKDNIIKKNTKIGIIGYGIQGRACALNLREQVKGLYSSKKR